MSGQYPPPNPTHPFNRAPHHKRTTPTVPPWGHSPQPAGMNMVGSSMNFYGSPHMGLPSLGTQPWVPPQTHPKPLDTRPVTSNPLFGLQMLMTPEASQRIPSEYQQEETMDLSSHSSTPAAVQDIPKIVSARSENNDLLRNGTLLRPEVNGDLDRTGVTEAEMKDSIVASVIAPNPLRENVSDPLNCSKISENSIVKRVDTTVPLESLSRDISVPTNPQVCLKSESAVDNEHLSEPTNSFESDAVKTSTSTIEPVKSKSTSSERLDKTLISDTVEKPSGENLQSLDPLGKCIGNFESSLPEFVGPPNQNESQSSYLDSSSLSVDTDDSKLVVVETSADDIFGISPVGDSAPTTSHETEKANEYSGVKSISEDIPGKTVEATLVTTATSDHQSNKSASTAVSSEGNSEPHPSVENVEILLENMFNSQEESSQNSNSSLSQSVIVSNGIKMPTEIPKPQVEIISPMKEEELAMTLAEDNPIEAGIKEEKIERKVSVDLMDEIEKKLEMLTESVPIEKPKCDFQVKFDPSNPDSMKKEPHSSYDTEGGNISKILSSNETEQPTEKVQKSSNLDVCSASSSQKSEPASVSNPFIEVETQLEKMFAGIVEPTEEIGSDNQSQPSVSEPKKPAKRSIIKRKKTNSRRISDNSVFGGCSLGDSTPLKKKGRKRVNDSGSERGSKKIKVDSTDSLKKGRVLKDVPNDSLSNKMKGPFLHIEGSRESPASVVVVNGGVRADDEDGADKANARRKHSKLQRTEGSRRAGPMYSSSTLSMRYNSDSADLSWVCVFCKKGPHCSGGLGGEPAGDLFGPYRIPSVPFSDDHLPPGTPADRDVVEEQKKRGGKHPKSLRASGVAEHFIQKMSKKSKRSLSTESWEPQIGLLPLDGGYEVWLHGPCAEWAPGLCIIGTQLVGLDDAVWSSLRTKCSQCGEAGAGICCVMRNCTTRMHYHCAVLCGWLLDTDTFIARCHVHRTRLRPA